MKSGFPEDLLATSYHSDPCPPVTPITLSPPVASLSPGLHPGAACGQLAAGEDRLRI